MPRNRTLAALIGLYAGLAACEDTSTQPELSPADAASPRAGALRWSATRLGITGGLATDVNNQGQVVGYRGTNQGTRAFLWSNGTFQHLGTLGGGDSRAFAINEAGQVIGRSTTATGATHAFLWQNGTMRDLGTLDAEFSDATGIDGSGRVVGSTENFSGMGTRAFLWENGQMRRLAGLDTVPSAATGIDNQGRIVGWYGDRQSPRAFLWTAGRVTDLGTLGGPWSAPTRRSGARSWVVRQGDGRAAGLLLAERHYDRLGRHQRRQQWRERHQRPRGHRRLEPAARQPASRGHLAGRRHVRHRGRCGRGRQ